ncbi:MAG: prepilin-type N-terminal cleavage/methylation domain-containing protein [Desulfobulbaceae bacterium]|nr:MAG: prepilin-type N-terminal cleavage/methylation domain-containing protein [Desulfobulbaceae bacterium]
MLPSHANKFLEQKRDPAASATHEKDSGGVEMKLKKTIQRQGGFTLVEIAIVLVIIGLLLGGLLIPFGQKQETIRRSDTRAQLAEVEKALYGFAQARGRLPCPATPESEGAEARDEDGVCTVLHGFVPAATLGLSGPVNADGLLLDAWKNPLRYSVDVGFTEASVDDGTGVYSGVKGEFRKTPPGTGDLRITLPPAGGTVPAPAVVLAMGKNWASFTSDNEEENAGEDTINGGPSGISYRIAADEDFVSTTYSEAYFDDMIIWLSPFILYHKMIKANQLP